MSDPELPTGWAYVTGGPDKAKYVVRFKDPEKEDKPVFKLTKGAYYSVWLYVMTGLMYPKNDERFGEIIPQENCESLNKIDSQAWTGMRDAIVKIHEHCDHFNDKSMSAWTSMTNDFITYCKYALSNFEGPDNFSQSLAVLVGAKYKRATDDDPEPIHDQAYKDAVETIQDICDDLKTTANKHKDACDAHIAAIDSFRNLTVSDKAAVDDLDFKFNSKKNPDGSERKCYTDAINEELARIRSDEAIQLSTEQEAAEEYQKDVIAATTSLTYAWWFPIGTLAAIGVATAFGVKATQAKERLEKAEKDYAKDVAKERALMTLANWVSHMAATVNNLDTIMGDARDAMVSIKDMFANQATGFDLISTELGDAENKFNKDYNLRKRILTKFSDCITEWKEVKRLAEDFLESSSPVIDGVKAASCAGNLEDLPNEAKPPEDR